MDETPRCARHPDVVTRLRCSSCEDSICPQCSRDAAVGYHCPDCAQARNDRAQAAGARIAAARGGRVATDNGGHLGALLTARVLVAGLFAAGLGGLLLGPVLARGAFFLLSSGAIGWVVARAVLWAADETVTPFVRAVALTLAGFTVAVGFATASGSTASAGLTLLAYPAAVWGGWLVVRSR